MSVDSVFQALGDPTRRAMLQRLGDGPLSVSQLAEPLAVSLAAVVQHLQVLEQSDLVRTQKVGRVRTCAINSGGLDIAERWIQDRRALTERRLDRLGLLLAEDEDPSPTATHTTDTGAEERVTSEAITHATFTVERTYPVPAARVFRAFSDTDVKRRWFADGEGWEIDEFTADFRTGGSETGRFRYAGGPPITHDTHYLDIVTDTRLVFSYVMTVDGKLISVSLASVELFPVPAGTRLVYTEQGQYIGGEDQAIQREIGCGEQYDALGAELAAS